jgi:DNA helicase-2/ATP-dependent DNA helicase PcrA
MPSQILGLTFTNKAADEMKQRLEKQSGARVHITTFHSLGARILRESIDALEEYTKEFAIFDESDSERLIKVCMGELTIDEKKLKARSARAQISRAKNELLAPDELEEVEPEVKELYALYQRRLSQYNGVDFDDLLYLPTRLFKEHPDVLARYQERWHYLLIDEYQDTNHAQYLLARLLVEKSKNLFVVGDPDQSIYSWRGADIGNILGFERDFPGAEVVKLEQNYRSTENILRASNALISHNESRYEKRLWSDLGTGELVTRFFADTDRMEARAVVEAIDGLSAEGVDTDQIAVLYRTNAQSRVLEDACLSHGLDYVVIGGISFYQRKEIKDILSWARFILMPSDWVSFSRLCKATKLPLGDATLDKIRLAGDSEGLSVLAVLEGALLGHVSMRLMQKQKDAIRMLIDKVRLLREIIASRPLNEALQEIIIQSGYMQVIKEDPETFEDRRENLESLTAKAFEFESDERGSLTDFLAEIALRSSLDEAAGLRKRVHLMTMHNAKGLEFDYVFIVGLEEDLLPHINSKDDPNGIEEERRLCYVAMTRARRRLTISACRRRFLWGGERSMIPSRFLAEMPMETIVEADQMSSSRERFARSECDSSYRAPRKIDRKPALKSEAALSNRFEVGDRVLHPEFGKGSIVSVNSGNFGLMYEVAFSDDGQTRTLVAEYAPLEPST